MVEGTDPVVKGVRFEQVAFMRAGLDDGVAVDDLLGFLRLDARAWEAATEPSDDRILDAVDEVDLAFLNTWTRRWPRRGRTGAAGCPLSMTIFQHWFNFLHALSTDPAPADFLRRMGVGSPEMACVHRGWSERMAHDEGLRAEALKILQEAPGECPIPAPQPVRLQQQAASLRNATRISPPSGIFSTITVGAPIIAQGTTSASSSTSSTSIIRTGPC